MKKTKRTNLKEIEQQEILKNHFARGINFYKLFWICIIGAFLGVVIETLWCILTRHVIESRTGLIYGPFNLVYGFGALGLFLGLYKIRNKRDGIIMIAGAIIGSVIEYICSFVQEKMFGSVSWDYSNFPYNLNGRINLLYSLFWGILAVLWIKNVYPKIAEFIIKIPNKIGKKLTWILCIFMIFNVFMSASVVLRWSGRINNIAAANKFETYIDKHYDDERMKKIFPNMKFS